MFVYLCMCSVYACIIGNISCLYFKGEHVHQISEVDVCVAVCVAACVAVCVAACVAVYVAVCVAVHVMHCA